MAYLCRAECDASYKEQWRPATIPWLRSEDRRVSTIIEEGRIRYTGTMKDLSRDREIQKEYLSA